MVWSEGVFISLEAQGKRISHRLHVRRGILNPVGCRVSFNFIKTKKILYYIPLDPDKELGATPLDHRFRIRLVKDFF